MKRLAVLLALVQLVFPGATAPAQEAEEPPGDVALAQADPAAENEPVPAPAEDQPFTRPAINRGTRQGSPGSGNRAQRRQSQRARNPNPGGAFPTYSTRSAERHSPAREAKSEEPDTKGEGPERVTSGTNGAPANFRAFRLIAERNIFNGTRTRRSGRPEPRERNEPAPTLTLVGILDYQKGPYAFFDGSGSEYKKVLEPGGKIAGYTLTEINPNSVKLASGSNTVELTLGMQLRREDSEWKVVRGSGAQSLTAFSKGGEGKSESAEGSEAEADIVKRLMKQREEEMK